MSEDLLAGRLRSSVERAIDTVAGLPIFSKDNIDTTVLFPEQSGVFIPAFNYDQAIEHNTTAYDQDIGMFTRPGSPLDRFRKPWHDGEQGHAARLSDVLDQYAAYYDLSRLPEYRIEHNPPLRMFIASLALQKCEASQPFIELYMANTGMIHEFTTGPGNYLLLSKRLLDYGESAVSRLLGPKIGIAGQEGYHTNFYSRYAEYLAYGMSHFQRTLNHYLVMRFFEGVGVSSPAHEIGLGSSGLVASGDDPAIEAEMISKINRFARKSFAHQNELAGSRPVLSSGSKNRASALFERLYLRLLGIDSSLSSTDRGHSNAIKVALERSIEMARAAGEPIVPPRFDSPTS